MKTTTLLLCATLSAFSVLSLHNGVTAQRKSCPLGMFCPIGANCTNNTSLCVVMCPTEEALFQQGNHLTGDCEKVSEDAHHWMDSTHYEICIPTNQTLNVDIRSISLISSEQFLLNNYTYNDLPEDVTFTLNGSCPDFYFSWPGMVKQTVVFQNYYDLYVADKIERVSLTVAKSVRPGDYEMQVIVTTAGNVIEKSDITVYVRDIQLCEASIGVTCRYNNGGCDHVCTNTGIEVNCSCLDGYLLINNRTCIDIDECSTGDHNCTENHLQQCVNRPGIYECVCVSGYELLNGTCIELTCQRNNGRCDHVCNDAEIGVNCSCHDGYQLVDNQTCIDIDECSTGDYSCAQNQQCVNRPGTFICVCVSGYELLNGVCKDINECLDNNGGCSHICNNTGGSYHCECPAGYVLQPDDHKCKDTDECSTGDHNCTQIQQCVNRPGTFICVCVSGYELSNGVCEDVNECIDNNGGCSHICNNTGGSYHCECPVGYVLQRDNHKCKENCFVTMLNGSIKVDRGKRMVALQFSSDGDQRVTFKCRLNKMKLTDCKSPRIWTNLERRQHTVIVKAFCIGKPVARRKLRFYIY